MLDRKLPTPVPPSCRPGTPSSNASLDVTTSDGVPDRIVLAMTGAIDMATGKAFRDALDDAIEHAQDVIVDLSAVTFMDSTGLNALVRCARQTRQRSAGTVRIRSPRPVVRRLLDVTGADRVIPVEADP